MLGRLVAKPNLFTDRLPRDSCKSGSSHGPENRLHV
jgi:hypothetical protein